MKNMRMVALGALAFGALAFSLAAGCAGSARRMPSPEELVRKEATRQGADVASLRRGRTLAVTRCMQCHRLYWPQEYSAEVWPYLLQDMAKRAALGDGQVRDIVSYYVAAARGRRTIPNR